MNCTVTTADGQWKVRLHTLKPQEPTGLSRVRYERNSDDVSVTITHTSIDLVHKFDRIGSLVWKHADRVSWSIGSEVGFWPHATTLAPSPNGGWSYRTSAFALAAMAKYIKANMEYGNNVKLNRDLA